jgi:hypothetical protein
MIESQLYVNNYLDRLTVRSEVNFEQRLRRVGGLNFTGVELFC